MKYDLAKLMYEALQRNKIKKKSFLKSEDSLDVDINLDDLLNLKSDKEDEEKKNNNHVVYLVKYSFYSYSNDSVRTGSWYVCFSSIDHLNKYIDDSGKQEKIKFLALDDDSLRDEDISKIKGFINCSEGDTLTMMEFGGEQKETYSKQGFYLLVHGPTEIVKVHEPIAC